MTYTVQRSPSHRYSAHAYASIGLETRVLSATPEQLITLLFNGAQVSINKARLHMQADNIEGRGMAISAAINIVESGLKASVDRNAGGALADSLIETYDLAIRYLLLANLNADLDYLELAERLLVNIGEAWRTAVDPGSCGEDNP